MKRHRRRRNRETGRDEKGGWGAGKCIERKMIPGDNILSANNSAFVDIE